MPRKGYRSLVMPTALYEKIKAHIDASEGRYVSVSEVAREAIWKFLHRGDK